MRSEGMEQWKGKMEALERESYAGVVQTDGVGPWIDMGRWALRPTGPTALSAGDAVRMLAGGWAGREAVAAVSGAVGILGEREPEAWLRGPQGGIDSGSLNTGWNRHFKNLAIFWTVNPEGGLEMGARKIEELMEKYRGGAVGGFEPKDVVMLVSEGRRLAMAAGAQSMAMALDKEIPNPVSKQRRPSL